MSVGKSQNYPVEGIPLGDVFVRNLHKLKGEMSQHQFAKLCQVSQTGMRKYLLGESSPTLQMIEQIAHACGVEAVSLLTAETNRGTQIDNNKTQSLTAFDIVTARMSTDERDALADYIIQFGLRGILDGSKNANLGVSENVLKCAEMLSKFSDVEIGEIFASFSKRKRA